MGWIAAGLLVEGTLDDYELALLPGAPQPTGESASGSEVFSSEFGGDYAVATVGEWTVLADPDMRAAYDLSSPLFTEGRRVLVFVAHGVASTYAIDWYVDGVSVRSIIDAEGERAVDDGDPIPEEAGFAVLDEDAVFALMHRLTGITFGQVTDATYRPLGNTQPIADDEQLD
ncbi:hypothetical protein [Nocardia sp. NPDC052566]|uniref:hypothetical protein n=1 Tax=Nocardia sp. NPDC052566 TaxID=3364330 RepID=UPI0037C4F4DD